MTGLALGRAGRHRAIADFTTTDGERHVLGTDLVVPGRAAEAPLPAAATTALVDGYDVTLDRPGEIVAGEEADLAFTVSRDGEPVTGLQPYLGAFGHLVALHGPSIAYSHAHPTEEDLAEGTIGFGAELQEAGSVPAVPPVPSGGARTSAEFTLDARSAE